MFVIQKSIFSLLSFHGKYLCFERPDQGGKITANRKEQKKQEVFEVILDSLSDPKNMTVSVRSRSLGTYLSSTASGEVEQKPDNLQPYQKWNLIDLGHENDLYSWAFQNVKTGLFLCAEKGSTLEKALSAGKVVANRKERKKFEVWKAHPLSQKERMPAELQDHRLIIPHHTSFQLSSNQVTAPNAATLDELHLAESLLEPQPFLQVDLKEPAVIKMICITNQTSIFAQRNLCNFWVMIGKTAEFAQERQLSRAKNLAENVCFIEGTGQRFYIGPFDNVVAQYVRIQSEGETILKVPCIDIRGEAFVDPSLAAKFKEIPFEIQLANNLCVQSSYFSTTDPFPAYYALNWDLTRFSSTGEEHQPHWQVNLEKGTIVSAIEVIGRQDTHQDKLSNFEVALISYSNKKLWSESRLLHANKHFFFPPDISNAKMLQIKLLGNGILQLASVRIKANSRAEDKEIEEEISKLTHSNSSSSFSSSSNSISSRSLPNSPFASHSSLDPSFISCPRCLGHGGFSMFRPCAPTDSDFKTVCPTCGGVRIVPKDMVHCPNCSGKGGIGPFGACDIVLDALMMPKPCPMCKGHCFLAQQEITQIEKNLEEEKKQKLKQEQLEKEKMELEKRNKENERLQNELRNISDHLVKFYSDVKNKFGTIETSTDSVQDRVYQLEIQIEHIAKKASSLEQASQIVRLLQQRQTFPTTNLEELETLDRSTREAASLLLKQLQSQQQELTLKKQLEEKEKLSQENETRKKVEGEELFKKFDQKKEESSASPSNTFLYLLSVLVIVFAWWVLI